MDHINSSLKLQKIVFDKIEFERKGFKKDNDLSFTIQVQIGNNGQSLYKVTLELEGEKKEEYRILISLSGFFEIENVDDLDEKTLESMIHKNTVAILMPYLRSEVTILTAQPETDSVVLPAFNINKIIGSKNEE